MTTIAFDGRYLAADTMSHRNGTPSNRASRKIATSNGCAYAICGQYACMIDDLIDWHRIGALPEAFPKHGEGSMLIVELASRRIWVVQGKELPYLDEEAAPFTAGSGGDIALGAMHAGVNAMEAVRIAAKCDYATNDVIDFIDLEWPSKGVQRWDGLMPVQTGHGDPVCLSGDGSIFRVTSNGPMRCEADEEGNLRVVADQRRGGVIGQKDMCEHGYVIHTCTMCSKAYAQAIGEWVHRNAEKKGTRLGLACAADG